MGKWYWRTTSALDKEGRQTSQRLHTFLNGGDYFCFTYIKCFAGETHEEKHNNYKKAFAYVSWDRKDVENGM